MLRRKQRTTPLPFDGAVALLERLLQIGRLGMGRLQLGVLVFGRLLGRFMVVSLVLTGSSAAVACSRRRSTSAWSRPLSSASWPRCWFASTRSC